MAEMRRYFFGGNPSSNVFRSPYLQNLHISLIFLRTTRS